MSSDSRETDKEIRDLVRLAKKGYQGAMEELVRLTENMVYHNCLRMLKSVEDARDMSQEVYLTVFEKLSTLKKEEAFFKWVRIITLNKCKNKLRDGNPYFLLEDLTQLDEDQNAIDLVEDKSDQSSPDKQLDNQETEEALLSAISELPDAQRMCVVMFYYDDLSIAEISSILEVSPNTVKSRLLYARKKIKEIMEKKGYEGFNMHGYPAAAFVSFITYFLQKAAQPDKGRMAALFAFVQGLGTAGAGAVKVATESTVGGAAKTLAVSAADAAIAEEAAILVAGTTSRVGAGAFFGSAFWTSVAGKIVVVTAATALVVGGAFGLSTFFGGKNESATAQGLIEVSESTEKILLEEESTEIITESESSLSSSRPPESSNAELSNSGNPESSEGSSEESSEKESSEESSQEQSFVPQPTEESTESSQTEESSVIEESSANPELTESSGTSESSETNEFPESSDTSENAESSENSDTSETTEPSENSDESQESSGDELIDINGNPIPAEIQAEKDRLWAEYVAADAAMDTAVAEYLDLQAQADTAKQELISAAETAKPQMEAEYADLQTQLEQLQQDKQAAADAGDTGQAAALQAEIDQVEARRAQLAEEIGYCSFEDKIPPDFSSFYGDYEYLNAPVHNYYSLWNQAVAAKSSLEEIIHNSAAAHDQWMTYIEVHDDCFTEEEYYEYPPFIRPI